MLGEWSLRSRNMGSVADNLFQAVNNGKRKGFNNTPNICVAGFQPLPAAYVEVSLVKDLSFRVRRWPGLMAGGLIIEES